MIFKKYFNNLLNKSPKIGLFIVVLFFLGHSQSSFFGYNPSKTVPKVDMPIETICQHFGEKVTVKPLDEVYSEVVSNNGDKVGAVLSSVKFSEQSKGYGGYTPVLILLNSQDIITGVLLMQNSETKRFVKRVEDAGFFNQWNGKHITNVKFIPEAVSGATLTSSSIIANVDATIASIATSYVANSKSFVDYLGSFAVLAVVALALVSYLFPAKMKPFRLVLLLSSVGVLGIWQGAFVSVQLLYNWAINGTSWSSFAIISIVALAVLIPIFTNKSFYCQNLCPFGVAQELLGKVTKNKTNIPKIILKFFRYIRQFALVGIFILLLVNPNFEPSSIEPFSVFMIRSATMSVIIIAGISLVTSIFITRPWCRLMCPTGEILSLLQRKIRYKRKRK